MARLSPFPTQPEHQLNLSRAALEALIGTDEASRLWRLPRSYRRQATVVAVPPPPAAGSNASAHQMRAQSAALRAEAVTLKKAGDAAGALELLRQSRALEALADSTDMPTAAGTDVNKRTHPAAEDDDDEGGGGGGGGGGSGVVVVRRRMVRRRRLPTAGL